MKWRGLVAISLACTSAQCAGVHFQQLRFTGEAENGVFSEDLNGDGVPDLVALGRGRISIYHGVPGTRQFSETPEVLLTGPIAYFADVADVLPAKGKEILIMTPTGVSCFAQQDGRYAAHPQDLLKCDTLLTARPVRGAIATSAFANVDVLPWDFAFDADGDGRDDVLVPHGNGTDVYLQKSPGQFAPPITLPLFPLVYHGTVASAGADSISARSLSARKALPVRIELIVRQIESRDVNGDGKLDLVCGDYWFAQKINGGFDTVPAEIPGGNPPTISYQMVDINHDGRIDRIAEENSFDDPLNIVTRVRYFLANPDGTLPPGPTDTIVGQNILVQTALPVHDFDGDGTLDFVLFKTDIQVTEIAKWVRQNFGKIDGDLNFYLFDRKTNRYPRRPAYTKPIRMSFKVDLMEAMVGFVWERYLGTMMRFEGDYNGDGRLDLLVREETNTIAIYYNTGSKGIFPRRPDIVLERVPNFGGLAIEDLNGDGCSDLVLFGVQDFFNLRGRSNDTVAVYVSQRR